MNIWLGLSITICRGGGSEDPPDPESGLTLTETFAVGSFGASCVAGAPAAGQISRDANAVFAMDFTDLDGDNGVGGRIFEAGGTGAGGYIGFRADGTFVWRIGDGDPVPQLNMAYMEVPPSDPNYPTGSGTLVCEAMMAAGAGSQVMARAWWNGSLIASNTSVNNVSQWSGAGSAEYLSNPLVGTMVTGEVTGAFTGYGSVSGLRYYYNQLSAL